MYAIIKLVGFFGWPFVSIAFFRKYSLPVAVCCTVIGGYLLMPPRLHYDFPLLPKIDKETLPVLVALAMTALALVRKKDDPDVLPGWIPRDRVVQVMLLLLVVSAFGSVLTNRDTLYFGPRVLPGHRLYDAFSATLYVFMQILPIFLARRVLATANGQRMLLTMLVVWMLGYSVLVAYEVRMSPQLNRMVYGFYQIDWIQHVRGEGFRPVVFLQHGLVLSLFMTFAAIGAAGLYRASTNHTRPLWLFACAWFFGLMVLTKSLGALIIAVILLPLVLFLKPRLQLLAAACIAGAILVYPVLRSADVVPVHRVLELAKNIDHGRATSFQIRVDNEDLLLARANERPLFGWGGWGRQRIFDEYGRNLSITDGSWVIELGAGGWTRYIGYFGLLCWPIIALFLTQRGRVDPVCACLALILCAKLIDLVPNSGVPPVNWLIAGALIGRLELKRAEQTDPAPTAQAPRTSVYSRFSGPPDDGLNRPAAPPKHARAPADAETTPSGPAPATGPAPGRAGYTSAKPAGRYSR